MLYQALQILTTEANDYLQSIGADKAVVLDNVARLENGDEEVDELEGKVILTLLTIDEEITLRNFPNNRLQGSQVLIRNNRVNLNLYVLFSSNRSTYVDSLNYISKILAFFQGKNLFTQNNSNQTEVLPGDELEDFRFAMELYTPSFEDLNYIWGTLGGKQYPSALYKMTLITIDRDNTLIESPAITQVDGDLLDT